MYLYERIIGIAIYLIILFFMCYYVYKSNKDQIGKVLFIYTILLSIMGFFFVPTDGIDLYRLFIYMHAYAKLNIHQLFDSIFTTGTPISLIYMSLIGKIGINGLLPAITSFICFNNIFYILKKSIIKYDIKPKYTVLVVIFIMGSGCYIETITGIRTMLSFCIIARCIFEEFIENKKIVKNIIWYIIAGLIHSVGLVLLLIRILYLIIERKNKRKSLNILKFFIVGIILISILIIGRVYFSTMFDKAIAYITKGTFSYIWEYIIGIIILIFIMEILHFYKKYIKCIDNNLGLYNIYKFTYIINIIVIALIMEYNTFHRFILLNAILIIPLLVYELKYVFENYDKKVCKNLYNIIILFSIIILILECARGNMTSLKFFEF